MTNLDQLEQWLTHANKGDSLVYHRGDLASDRESNPEVRTVADYVRFRSEITTPILSACGHTRKMIEGTGELVLSQRRLDGGIYEYVATKRR